jgi:hypothetical protein
MTHYKDTSFWGPRAGAMLNQSGERWCRGVQIKPGNAGTVRLTVAGERGRPTADWFEVPLGNVQEVMDLLLKAAGKSVGGWGPERPLDG